MTWLVIGANGQLGLAFKREFSSLSEVKFVNRRACDLANPASVTNCLTMNNRL